MATFKRNGKKELQAISTASLPDIVFMLLFFFMVSTSMRDTEKLVTVKLPEATETAKITRQKTLKPLRTKEKPAISADCWFYYVGARGGT